MISYIINSTEKNCGKKYGIDVLLDGNLIKSVEDITDKLDDIKNLVSICNELDISLCHIDDIIEDYLTDFRI